MSLSQAQPAAKRPLHAFTVDLEEWFQGLTSTNPLVDQWTHFESRILPATRRLLGILREHKTRATFFVLGYVADHFPALIDEIMYDDHELAVHGYYHRFVYRMTPEAFAQELDLAIAALQRITGSAPIGHRAPYFSLRADTDWAFAILVSRGIRYDSSIFPARNMLYGIAGAPKTPYRVEGLDLIEFPATTLSMWGITLPIAGGFYNRAMPYVLTRQACRRLERAGRSIITYVHPWELDTKQRYGNVTPRERLTHYYGRRGLEKKLHRLLSDFSFGPLVDLWKRMHAAPNKPAEERVPA